MRLILSLVVERLVYSGTRMKRRHITHARDTSDKMQKYTLRTETVRFKPSCTHREFETAYSGILYTRVTAYLWPGRCPGGNDVNSLGGKNWI